MWSKNCHGAQMYKKKKLGVLNQLLKKEYAIVTKAHVVNFIACDHSKFSRTGMVDMEWKKGN